MSSKSPLTTSQQTSSHCVQRILSGLKMLLLLSCWIIAGVTADDPPTMHYRVKNSSLCLQVGKSPPFRGYQWIFDDKFIVIDNNNITPRYKDKVDYDPGSHSLCIKNLTETDSGTYKVTITDSDFHLFTETHTLIVEETVSRPVIRMKVLRSNKSAGFCNITVNCSVQGDWAWSVCNGVSCRTSLISFVKVNITISSDNRTVVCSGHNHVSTSNASESMEAMCFNKTNPEHEEATQPTTVIVIVIAIAVFILLFTFLFFVTTGFCSSEYHHRQAQTSITQLTQSQPFEAEPRPVTRGSTSSSGQSEASYENVEATHRCPTISQRLSREELGSEQSPKVDSVYCVLEVPNVTASHRKSDSSKDTKGHKKIQEASASQSATLDEAQRPTQIDTVYSVLQKPKI